MTDRVAPLFVGRDNCVAVIGREWRVVQHIARDRGVRPRRVGRITLYRADELAAAIDRHVDSTPAAEQPNDGIDELAALRARLGKRRKRA
jgi:hypothetical protein